MKAKKMLPKSIRFNIKDFDRIMSVNRFESAQEMVDFLLSSYYSGENVKLVTPETHSQVPVNILDEIINILDEKIPKERDTPNGRPFWWSDQKNKIKNLIYEYRGKM